MAVAVSAHYHAALTPYLIRAADPLSHKAGSYGGQGVWHGSYRFMENGCAVFSRKAKAPCGAMIRRILLQVGVNLALVIAIFFSGGYFAARIGAWLSDVGDGCQPAEALIWGAALLLSLPFLIAAIASS